MEPKTMKPEKIEMCDFTEEDLAIADAMWIEIGREEAAERDAKNSRDGKGITVEGSRSETIAPKLAKSDG